MENRIQFLKERKEAGMLEAGVGISICQSRGCPLQAKLTAYGIIHLQLPFHFVMKTKHVHIISMAAEMSWTPDLGTLCTVSHLSHNRPTELGAANPIYR